MAEGASTESRGTGSQTNPELRQRVFSRAATFTEGASQLHPLLNRRRNSLLSDHSDTRQSFRSAADSALRPEGNNDMERLTSTEGASYWHSAPLVFAILPAIAGLLFPNGGPVVTDVLLLGISSIYLNWCVRWPWEWYYSAQEIRHVQPGEAHSENAILEEDENKDESRTSDPSEMKDSKLSGNANHKDKGSPPPTETQQKARRELRKEERMALFACFLGPLLGSCLLHAIRGQLTHPAEGLVSNYNLTIFVIASESRLAAHLIKMKNAGTFHLQRVVQATIEEDMSKEDMKGIQDRLAHLEARIVEPAVNTDLETSKISANLRQGIQPQLDALNRAVRRYEKRSAAQSIQTEARFQEVDARLKDALALAAAAVRTGQRPGIISVLITWIANVITLCVRTGWVIVMYPFRIMATVLSVIKSWFVTAKQQPRKRSKGQQIGHHSVLTPKMQSRNGK